MNRKWAAVGAASVLGFGLMAGGAVAAANASEIKDAPGASVGEQISVEQPQASETNLVTTGQSVPSPQSAQSPLSPQSVQSADSVESTPSPVSPASPLSVDSPDSINSPASLPSPASVNSAA